MTVFNTREHLAVLDRPRLARLLFQRFYVVLSALEIITPHCSTFGVTLSCCCCLRFIPVHRHRGTAVAQQVSS